MTSIHVSDIGPVEEFRLDMDQPGLWILTGKQGAGKTTILRTVQLATDGRTDIKPTKRDGTPRGEATIAGRTLRIAKQVREEGDLTVDGLGDLDIASLHTPKFVDAPTRDKHRIKTLVRLAGVRADASLFHNLLGGKGVFDQIVNADALTTDDLVEMAARVKRAIEKAAQDAEAKRETALANMRASAAIAEGADLSAPHDETALQESLTKAIENRSRMVQQQQDGLEVRSRADEARRQLAAIDEGQTVEQVEKALDVLTHTVTASRVRVADLERQLAEAKANLNTAVAMMSAAHQTLTAVKRHAEMAARWKADIDAAAAVECPSDEDLATAEEAIKSAQDAVRRGLVVRQAIAARAQAEQHAAEAKRLTVNSRRLRDAARDTQDVLSGAIARIPECPLRISLTDDGDVRLVVHTDRSEAEPFDELSDGERWPYIIRLAAGRNRLIVLPQAAYGELSPETRNQLHDLAVANGCFLLTAQADDAELRGEIYKPELAAVSA